MPYTPARLLAEIARRDPQVVAELLPRALPWVRFLPASAVREFAEELVTTSGDFGDMPALSVLLSAWRHTAEAHSDPELHAVLAGETSGDYGPVS
ncbi:hypothetical protein Cme02nite_60400 [Catellatospora methionotrophica]|uniref:Uncharacterized protein n=1 Tax=Catellatospora methionotrophica TaxID=121620 RepID=A0A8J3LB60_9ACTN|nr:hypothetical protein [Catellatospora methionotrophica]GIG17708.1 hypothetical protein Cme02nite_60400 [Catellatospora methionotrophica]